MADSPTSPGPSSSASVMSKTTRARPQFAPMGPRQSRSSRTTSLPAAATMSPRVATLSRLSAQEADRDSTRSASPTTDAPLPVLQSIPTDVQPEDAFDDSGIVIEPPDKLAPTPPPLVESPANGTPSPANSSPSHANSSPSHANSSPSPTPIIQKSPSLTPPPPVCFDSQPVKWKGLPLEAALWTLDSEELQDIVSRAIRSSARESYIRILPVRRIDHTLPTELARLDAARASAQARYRFGVQRRTMLLQALAAHSGGADAGDFALHIARQLSDVMADCDECAEALVRAVDHTAQINRMLDQHWGSALAVALRKLNTSFGRRTAQLDDARERIGQLEAEVDEAWNQAHRIAQEMDEAEDEAERVAEELMSDGVSGVGVGDTVAFGSGYAERLPVDDTSDPGSDSDTEDTRHGDDTINDTQALHELADTDEAIIHRAEVVPVNGTLSPRPSIFTLRAFAAAQLSPPSEQSPPPGEQSLPPKEPVDPEEAALFAPLTLEELERARPPSESRPASNTVEYSRPRSGPMATPTFGATFRASVTSTAFSRSSLQTALSTPPVTSTPPTPHPTMPPARSSTVPPTAMPSIASDDDRGSIRSARSTRSVRRVTQVHAARQRSVRTTAGNLRLPARATTVPGKPKAPISSERRAAELPPLPTFAPISLHAQPLAEEPAPTARKTPRLSLVMSQAMAPALALATAEASTPTETPLDEQRGAMQHPLPPNVHRDSFLNLSGDEASPVRVNEHGVLASVSELPGETTPAAEGGPPSSSLGDRLGLDLGSKHESLRGAWDTLRGKRKRPRDPARPSTSDGLLSRAPVFSSPLSAGAPRLRTSSVSRRDLAASEGSPVSRPDASPVSRRGGPSPFSPPVRRGSIKIGGLPRRTNIEDITLVPGDGSEVGSSSLESHGVAGAHSMDDIQELPRAPGWHRPGKSADDLGERDGHGELPGRTIPSIWANADASGHRSPPVSPSRFGKLKGFTKRYSMSLTSFSQQSNISKKFLPKS